MYVDPTASELLDQPAHRALAKEVAAQGITLLKNEGGLLPMRSLASTAKKKKSSTVVAVLGPLGDSVHAMIGQSGYAMPGARVVTVQRAVAAAGHAVLAADGANVINEDQSGIAAAVALIPKAELVLLVLGENQVRK
jgi:beta-glucosidase